VDLKLYVNSFIHFKQHTVIESRDSRP
jgi:large subunit GTPase 1